MAFAVFSFNYCVAAVAIIYYVYRFHLILRHMLNKLIVDKIYYAIKYRASDRASVLTSTHLIECDMDTKIS